LIRSYTDDDLEAVLDIWYRASLEVHWFLPAEFFETERRLLAEQFLPYSETVVYELVNRVVGFLSLVGNEVGGVFVDPGYQRQGIGRALMYDARAKRPYLELSVFEENHSGRSFYASYGFRKIGRQINEETGHPELRLRLD